jgi:hypothetical protein
MSCNPIQPHMMCSLVSQNACWPTHQTGKHVNAYQAGASGPNYFIPQFHGLELLRTWRVAMTLVALRRDLSAPDTYLLKIEGQVASWTCTGVVSTTVRAPCPFITIRVWDSALDCSLSCSWQGYVHNGPGFPRFWTKDDENNFSVFHVIPWSALCRTAHGK